MKAPRMNMLPGTHRSTRLRSGQLVSLVLPMLLAGRINAQAAPPHQDAKYEIERHTLKTGHYLVAVPDRLVTTDRPPVILALHGTNTNAADILRIWLSLDSPIPFIFLAPQSAQPGWRDDEAALVRDALAEVADIHHADPKRILLTGHSAGGAMAFHLVYYAGLSATHVATTANYLPVHITKDLIHDRREIPIFYGVGRRDLNRDRMRAGVNILRSSGAQVTIERPDIGHVLDRALTQQAMDWFNQQLADDTDARIRRSLQYHELEDSATAVRTLEGIINQARWHARRQVARARAALTTIEQPGLDLLSRARRLAAAKRTDQAVRLIRQVEKRYVAGGLADQARAMRRRIAPNFADAYARGDTSPAARETEAKQLLLKAIELTSERKFADAKTACRRVLNEFTGTDAVGGANRLLSQLQLAPTQ